jgi:hypothetical protein
MSQAPATVFEIPTDSPQPGPARAARPGISGSSGRGKKASGPSRSPVFASGNGRAATRGSGEVIELECGVTVYPARSAEGRWRAVWHEDGQRRQCEAASEESLAAKLEKVQLRLEADAPNMTRPGADLIAHYLDPDRLPRAGSLVAQACPYPGPAVRAVRRPGHRRGHLPGHQRPATCSRSSTQPRRPARATGSGGWSPRSSRPASTADTW